MNLSLSVNFRASFLMENDRSSLSFLSSKCTILKLIESIEMSSGELPKTIALKVWKSVESCADFVADLFGVTAPKYELYLDDAEEYQKQVCILAMLDCNNAWRNKIDL